MAAVPSPIHVCLLIRAFPIANTLIIVIDPRLGVHINDHEIVRETQIIIIVITLVIQIIWVSVKKSSGS